MVCNDAQHQCRCQLVFITSKNIFDFNINYLKFRCVAYLGMGCKNDSECSSVLDNTICSDDRCRCQIRYKQNKYNACGPILSVPCFGNDTCVTKNSICIDNVCECKPNFLKRGFKCLPSKFFRRIAVKSHA